MFSGILLYNASVDDDLIFILKDKSPLAILSSIAVNDTDWFIFQFDDVNISCFDDIVNLSSWSELMFNTTSANGCDFNLNIRTTDWPSFNIIDESSYIIPTSSLSLIFTCTVFLISLNLLSSDDEFIVMLKFKSPFAMWSSIAVNVTVWSVFQFDGVNVSDELEIDSLSLWSDLIVTITLLFGLAFSLNMRFAPSAPSISSIIDVSKSMPAGVYFQCGNFCSSNVSLFIAISIVSMLVCEK